MNLTTVLSVLAFTSLLTLSSVNAPKVMAANPNFAVTSILTPQEGEALFRSEFKADDLFGKQDNRHNVKQTYWTPTAAEVHQAENSLAGYTGAINNAYDQSVVQIDPTPYDIFLTTDIRQIAGVMQGSKRLLLINGLPFPSDSRNSIFTVSSLFTNEVWHNRTGHASDGGSAFLAAYDLDAHRVISLNFDYLVQRKQPQVLYRNLSLTFG